jgi:two-component sensor histidine kinase
VSIFTLINTVANLGIKKNYQPWEIFLVRKLNLTTLYGTVSIIVGLLLFVFTGYYDSIAESLIALFLSPFVFILTIRYGYVLGIFLFAFIGCFLFFVLSVEMGSESFAFLYFFPFVLGLLQMLGRKETYFYLAIILCFCALTISAIIFSYYFSLFQIKLPNQLLLIAKNINIFISFFTAVAFIFIISFEANEQENQLKTALKQKEVLLAELFHRVKNNLNIVTSLLNLKKDTVASQEAHDAIEECRNMVFSMAMVHTRIYNSNSIDHLNFKEYLHDLSNELINSIGGSNNVEFELNTPLIYLNATQAIPCGLIVNEFITNAFKHAQVKDRKLKISLNLKKENEMLFLELKDNGPGNMTQQQEKNSLGLGLIKSLTEQLNGECYFFNNSGLQLDLKFKKII